MDQEQPKGMIDILSIKTPKIVVGQSGPYFRVATGDNGDLYLRFKFENMLAETPEGIQPVDGLQVNVMYVGHPFQLPMPFKAMSQRRYLDGDNDVSGMLLAKLYSPMGLFQRNLKNMHEYVMNSLAQPLDAALDPLLDAGELQRTMGVAELVAFMLEGMQDQFPLEPVVMHSPEFWKNTDKLIGLMHKAKKAKKASKSDEPEDPHDEPDPEDDEDGGDWPSD